MASIFIKYRHAIQTLGLRRAIEQLYTIGDVKFGELVGTDRWGNKYYENLEYPFGQHRWVEFADIHNYDAAMVPPEWHGWFHHMTDSPGPDSAAYIAERLQSKKELFEPGTSHAPYDDHVGLSNYEQEFIHNWSQFRHRGYKMGSLHMNGDDEDKFWTQPGHMLNSLNKRAEAYNGADHKGYNMADLSQPESAESATAATARGAIATASTDTAPQRNDLLEGKN